MYLYSRAHVRCSIGGGAVLDVIDALHSTLPVTSTGQKGNYNSTHIFWWYWGLNSGPTL
jgi:hypothetical protein